MLLLCDHVSSFKSIHHYLVLQSENICDFVSTQFTFYFLMFYFSLCICSSFEYSFIIHFPLDSQLEHRAPFGVSVITHTIRHTVGLLWTNDQPVTETTQHNI
jgi:hypothetical protein